MNMKTEIRNVSIDSVLKELETKRTRCLVYTRVMGYHRPIESFNIGKKAEHKQRLQFQEKCC